MTEVQYISDITNAHSNECSCQRCANMCARCPCLGTPNDILRLINNGLGEFIQDTAWAVGLLYYGHPDVIDMVQLKSTQNGCCMLENGKCKLHQLNLKPTEGVLATCNPIIGVQHLQNLSYAVAKDWEHPRNAKAIRIINNYLTKRQKITT